MELKSILTFFERFWKWLMCLVTAVIDILEIILNSVLRFISDSWLIFLFIVLFGVGGNFLINNY